ncbi:MAG: dihydropteroate synthase-like protein [Candidatus Heimdallarchaeota archaeon]
MPPLNRVLLLTGRMAYGNLSKIKAEFPNVDIEALPISVAAFTTPKLIRRHVPKAIVKWRPELILVSGLARGNYDTVGRELGVPILKGTRNLSALPLLLRKLEVFAPKLSPTASADNIMRDHQIKFLQERINELEKEVEFGTRNFRLRSKLSIGIDLPPRVMAEIVDATHRSVDDGLSKARRFSKWADILDVGGVVDKPDPEKVAEIVVEIRKLGLPVSVDTLNPEEIIAGVDAGAEIVLSVDRGNVAVIQRLPEDTALVCLPTNVSKGVFPRNPVERAKICHELSTELQHKGYEKLLADPLLEAPIQPGLMQSLAAFLSCRELSPNLPFLAGFGNVTEFIDADTSGINALLACLGTELGISVFLSTEERAATIHCIRELHSAANMAFVAKIAESAPKDVGFTSFAAKSSRFDVQPVREVESFQFVSENDPKTQLDPKGCFKIGIDHQNGRILCEHRFQGKRTSILASDKANALLQKILAKGLVSRLDHAAYVGSELTKAEISLILGHNYQQDMPWDTAQDG